MVKGREMDGELQVPRPSIPVIKLKQRPKSTRRKIYDLLSNPESSRWARYFQLMLHTAATLSCTMIVIATFDGPSHGSVDPKYPNFPSATDFLYTDLILTVIFLIDFGGRFLTTPKLFPEKNFEPNDPDSDVEPFFSSWFTLFDFLSIMPFFADVVFGDKVNLGMLRLIRLLRILKVMRHFSGTSIIHVAVVNSIRPLTISVVFLIQLALFFGIILYLLDPCYKEYCGPTADTVGGFQDVFDAAYFTLVTICTVGYGDFLPSVNNWYAQSVVMLIMVIGTLFLAMPLAIVGTEFDRAWRAYTPDNDPGTAKSLITLKQRHSIDEFHGGEPALDINRIRVLSTYADMSEDYLRFSAHIGVVGSIANSLPTVLSGENVKQMAKDLKQLAAVLDLSLDMRYNLQNSAQKLIHLPKHQNRIESIVATKRLASAWKRKTSNQIAILQSQPTEKILREKKKEETKSGKLHQIALYMDKCNVNYSMDDVKRAMRSSKRTSKIWLFIEVPHSSKPALIFHSILLYSIFLSVLVMVWETMYIFQKLGHTTPACARAVEDYCGAVHTASHLGTLNSTFDPGCFVWDPVKNTTDKLLRFNCKSSDCFGQALNFGSSLNGSLACLSDPFRRTGALQAAGAHDPCFRQQCSNSLPLFLDMSDIWIVCEYYFAFLFAVELILHICSNRVGWKIWKLGVFWTNLIALGPFVYLEIAHYMSWLPYPRTYSIPAGSRDLFTVLRLMRVGRFFLQCQTIPGTHILYQSIRTASTKLVLPYFLLTIFTTACAFVIYQFEKGTECFVGKECIVGNVNINATFPEDILGLTNKRVLVDTKGQISRFNNFFSAFWFTITAITSVGYGDVIPITQPGRLVTVVVILFGACYTAMPLTLMGEEFYKRYQIQRRREALVANRREIHRGFLLTKRNTHLWNRFRDSSRLYELPLRRCLGGMSAEVEKMKTAYEESGIKPDKKSKAFKKKVVGIQKLASRAQLYCNELSFLIRELKTRGRELAEEQSRIIKKLEQIQT